AARRRRPGARRRAVAGAVRPLQARQPHHLPGAARLPGLAAVRQVGHRLRRRADQALRVRARARGDRVDRRRFAGPGRPEQAAFGAAALLQRPAGHARGLAGRRLPARHRCLPLRLHPVPLHRRPRRAHHARRCRHEHVRSRMTEKQMSETADGPLAGIRVLEVAMYGFVPSAGAVLADWGADVIKVEHAVTGDPQRGLRRVGQFVVEGEPNPNVEHANRGKRSIGVDMSTPQGRELIHQLARRADVFLTSFLPRARAEFGIDLDDIRAVNPSIVYARGSALGPRGVESDRGGYDMTAFWCRGGIAATITAPGIEGMIQPPGPAFGDTISGTNLAGGIAAALLKRERTGTPSVVDVSLLGSGLWSLGHTVALSAYGNKPMVAPQPGAHGAPTNPLSGLYETADGRYLSFVMLQPGKFWADVCRHIDRPELADDPRFADAARIAEHTAEAVAILRAEIK